MSAICSYMPLGKSRSESSSSLHTVSSKRAATIHILPGLNSHPNTRVTLRETPHVVFLLNQTQTTLKRKLSLDHWFSPSCCSLVTDLENPARNNGVGARKGEKNKKTSGFCHSVCRRGHIRGVWTNIDMSGDFRGSLFSSVPLPRLAWVGLNRAWASHRECARRVPVAAAAQINHSPSILSFILLHTLTRIC